MKDVIKKAAKFESSKSLDGYMSFLKGNVGKIDNMKKQPKVPQTLKSTRVNAKKLWSYANNLEKESEANKFMSNVLDRAGMKKSSEGYFRLSEEQGSKSTKYRDKAIKAINKATGRDIPLPPTEFNS